MTDLSLVTFEEMWDELKKRTENGLYISVVMAMAWRSDTSGSQRPDGSAETSGVYFAGGYHAAIGNIEAAKAHLLAGEYTVPEEPPDIDGDEA